jgi:hypothetical protein
MNTFDQLTARLHENIKPLAVKAKSLFFALSAYRLYPIYEYNQRVCDVGDSALLKQILNDAFEHAAKGWPVSQALCQTWDDTLLELTPHDDDIGVLAGNMGCVTTLVGAIGGTLCLGEWYFREPGIVDYCLLPFRFTIGLEKFDTSCPGTDDVDEFYDVIMNDDRFLKEKRNLENDITSLLQGASVSFTDFAIELRERALINKWDGEAFCAPLAKLEMKYREERKMRKERMHEPTNGIGRANPFAK